MVVGAEVGGGAHWALNSRILGRMDSLAGVSNGTTERMGMKAADLAAAAAAAAAAGAPGV